MAQLMQTAPTGGVPKSVAEHGGLVYVLNTDRPSVTGFRVDATGLSALPDSTRMLQPDSDPAQVGFSPDGRTLMITERGANAIASYPVRVDGLLGEPHLNASCGQTPYGFAFTPQGALIVTEAFGAKQGRAAASSYLTQGDDLSPASRSIGSGHSEVCWAVASNDGRYVFTTNFGDGSVTRYAIADDGSLSIDDATAATTVEGATGLRDESLSSDGRFLYALHADSQSLYGWAVGQDGSLTPIGSWEGLPETVAGLAVS
jgi:6-phosphogluconolactonase